MIEKTPTEIIRELVKKKDLRMVEFAELTGKSEMNVRNTLAFGRMKVSTFKHLLESLDKELVIKLDNRLIKIV